MRSDTQQQLDLFAWLLERNIRRAIEAEDWEMAGIFAAAAKPFLEATAIGYTFEQAEWWNILSDLVKFVRKHKKQMPDWVKRGL